MEDRAAKAIGAVWRIESARIVAGVARLVRDLGLAEELAGAHRHDPMPNAY